MAFAPPRPCASPGCPELVRGKQRRCAAHERARHQVIDSRRGSSTARGYDAAWRRVRDAFLASHPLCELECAQQGRVTPATVVDHVVPIAEDPRRRLDPSNLRSACKPCHDARTMRDQVQGRGDRWPR